MKNLVVRTLSGLVLAAVVLGRSSGRSGASARCSRRCSWAACTSSIRWPGNKGNAPQRVVGLVAGIVLFALNLAFVSDDIGFIVEEALKTIPEQSRYHRCMKDVIAWHKQYPGDWKRTWFECEKKWRFGISDLAP